MGFTGFTNKLGSSCCSEYFPAIAIRNDFEGTDNSVEAACRMLLNDERLAEIKTSGNGVTKCQVLLSETNLNLESAAGVTLKTYGGTFGPFKIFKKGLFVSFILNKNSADYIRAIAKFNSEYFKSGWQLLKDVSLYLDNKGDVLAYQNPEREGTIIIAPFPKRYQVMQLAASCLPRIFPWCFKEYPLTEKETAVLKLFAESKYDELTVETRKAFESFDFYGKKVQEIVKGFCSQNFNRAINKQQNVINEAEYTINRYIEDLHKARKKLEEEQLKMIALQNKACNPSEDEQNLIDFLRANKSLILLKKENDRMEIGVNCYLNDFNEDLFEQYFVNAPSMSSYIFNQSTYDFETTQKLFMAIWGQHRFNVRVYCSWLLYDDGKVEAVRFSDMCGREDLTEDRLPQPHINNYQCFSGYRETLEALGDQRDYIGLLSTIQASSASINWTDSAVVSTLMDWMFDSKRDVKFLEDADGNHYTVDQVVEILNKEGKNN